MPPECSLPFQAEPIHYYIYDPRVPRRVKDLLPDVKVILLLRSPVERGFSHYRHNVKSRRETRTFEDAIQEELDRGPESCLQCRQTTRSRGQHHRHFAYLTRGLYLEQIKDWHSVFPKEQMLVIRSEDFFGDTATAFARVLDFLGLESWRPEAGFPPLNVGIVKTIDRAVQDRVAAFYKSANEDLYNYLQVDFGW